MSSYNPFQWKPRDFGSMIIVLMLLLVLSYYTILKPLLSLCGRTNHTRRISRNNVQRILLHESINVDGTSQQLQSHGFDFSVVDSLPLQQFKKSEDEGEFHQKPIINTDCAICLGEFEEGEWLKHLPNCSHGFHALCIDMWFQSHSSCPLCRSYVQNNLTDGVECHVSSYTLLENLRRGNFFQERDVHLQSIHPENMAIR